MNSCNDKRKLIDYYENLRNYSLGENIKFNIPLGMDLFKKRGLKSWVELLVQNKVNGYRIETKKTDIPIIVQEELTILLANMISNYGGVENGNEG